MMRKFASWRRECLKQPMGVSALLTDQIPGIFASSVLCCSAEACFFHSWSSLDLKKPDRSSSEHATWEFRRLGLKLVASVFRWFKPTRKL